MKNLTAMMGALSVSVFVITFLTIANLNSDFNILTDYISKLGAVGQPYSRIWNYTGIGFVGASLATIGWLLGACRPDRVLGFCLVLSGVGFALAAIPTDLNDADSTLSKIHFVSVCMSLAGWCMGLSRLTSHANKDSFSKSAAYVAVTSVAFPLMGLAADLIAEPIAHRMILAVIFAWVGVVSYQLIRTKDRSPEYDTE